MKYWILKLREEFPQFRFIKIGYNSHRIYFRHLFLQECPRNLEQYEAPWEETDKAVKWGYWSLRASLQKRFWLLRNDKEFRERAENVSINQSMKI